MSDLLPGIIDASGETNASIGMSFSVRPPLLNAFGEIKTVRVVAQFFFTGPDISLVFGCTLTGAPNSLPDLDLSSRMSNFQAQKSNAQPTYLTATIKGVASIIDDIEARPGGDIVISVGRKTPGGNTELIEIIRANFTSLQTSVGSTSSSVTISGYAALGSPPPPITVALLHVISSAFSGGKLSFRTRINHSINPGDSVTYESYCVIVGRISYSVSPSQQTFDLFEA